MIALVKFAVGQSHPLFGKAVYAQIKFEEGYDNMSIVGETINPQPTVGAVWNYEKHKYELTSGPLKIHTGWVDTLYSEKFGKWVTAQEFSEYQNYIYLKSKFGNL